MKIVAPHRATHTYTQHLVGSAAEVFPLLCPVREVDWIEGWDPALVVSASGVAETDCVFTTSAQPSEAIWYITRHEPAAGFVEMLKITPQVTACRLTIQLRTVDTGCEADITYSHTSLGPAGDAFVASFTAESYRKFMLDWEARVNHYLRHGSALRTGEADASMPGNTPSNVQQISPDSAQKKTSRLERRTLEFYDKYRERNPGFGALLRLNAALLLYWACVSMLAFAALFGYGGWHWALPGVALLLGAALRDLRRIYSYARQWPKSRDLMNWEEVDRRLAALRAPRAG